MRPDTVVLRPGSAVIAACFLASGATSLVYQVVWVRMLSMVLGHGIFVLSAVLAAFMTGLALGSALASRRVDCIDRPVAAYGWIELAIGGYALLLLLLSPWAQAAHAALAPASVLGPFLLAWLILLPPTTLMGATLPLLSHALARGDVPAGTTVGRLYALNTAGAVLGAVGAGYLLLPALGNARTLALGAAVNLAIGVVAIVGSRRMPRGATVVDTGREPVCDPGEEPGAPPAPPSWRWLTFAVVAVSGAVAMVYEMATTRALALVIGSSTYAFSAMLAAFLVGITGGSALLARRARRGPMTLASLAALQLGVAVAVAGAFLTLPHLPAILIEILRSTRPAWISLVQLAISLVVLVPATLCIGATPPCAVALVSRGARSLGRDAGEIYAVSTVGALAGTVAAGLWLVPAIGVQGALKAGILANLGLGAVLWLAGRGRGRAGLAVRAGAVAAGVLVVGVVVGARWDDRVMTSGAAIYARRMPAQARLADLQRERRLLYYRDGPSATVTVSEEGGARVLRINGKVDASTGGDMHTQLMSGHLPLMLHPDPRSVLVIGLGSGVTVGAVVRHPVERVTVAELEPAVVEAAAFFSDVHGGALGDPRVRTLVVDGRHLLAVEDGRYDVIVSEPSNLWIGGMAALFTAEFFGLARERLRPDGLMLQWVQLYGLAQDDLRMVVGTFRSVFPATTIWHTSRGDLLLVGGVVTRPIDVATVRDRFPRAATDLARLGVRSWPGILGYALLGEEDAARFADGAPLNIDDRLTLEFTAPRSLYLDTGPSNVAALQAARRRDFPEMTAEGRALVDEAPVRVEIGHSALMRGAPEEALRHFRRAVETNAGLLPALEGTAAALLNLGRTGEAWDVSERIMAIAPKSARGFFLGGLAAGRLGRLPQAVALLEVAASLDPGNTETAAVLAHTTRLARRAPLTAGRLRDVRQRGPRLRQPSRSAVCRA